MCQLSLALFLGMRSSPPQKRGGFPTAIDGLSQAIVHPMPRQHRKEMFVLKGSVASGSNSSRSTNSRSRVLVALLDVVRRLSKRSSALSSGAWLNRVIVIIPHNLWKRGSQGLQLGPERMSLACQLHFSWDLDHEMDVRSSFEGGTSSRMELPLSRIARAYRTSSKAGPGSRR
jgi:hypothetical protein